MPSEQAPAVAAAFRLRADGATIDEIREHLRANGIKRSWHGVNAMLRNRTGLGEINFGELVNTEAHEPIVDAQTWQKAQQTVLRGTRLVSKRLLARQGVLRCGTCGARMVISTQSHKGRTYGYYRCPPMGDCGRRAAIAADVAEQAVSDHVRAALADIEGRASAQANIRDAEQELERTQDALDAALRTLADFSDQPALAVTDARMRVWAAQVRGPPRVPRRCSSTQARTPIGSDRMITTSSSHGAAHGTASTRPPRS